MWLRLILATLGVSIFLSLLKNFLALEKGWRLDGDGICERALIVLIFWQGGVVFILLPIVILFRIFFYLNLHRHLDIIKINEPGALFQKIKIKSELLVDLLGSPLSAILICFFIP